MMTIDHILRRLDRITEEAEETKWESFTVLRNTLPADLQLAFERAISEKVAAIQRLSDELYQEAREIEDYAVRPLTSAADSLWTVAADRGFQP